MLRRSNDDSPFSFIHFSLFLSLYIYHVVAYERQIFLQRNAMRHSSKGMKRKEKGKERKRKRKKKIIKRASFQRGRFYSAHHSFFFYPFVSLYFRSSPSRNLNEVDIMPLRVPTDRLAPLLFLFTHLASALLVFWPNFIPVTCTYTYIYILLTKVVRSFHPEITNRRSDNFH